MRHLVLLLCLLAGFYLSAQQKSFLQLESFATAAGRDIMPTWLYANEWGKYQSEADFNASLYAKADLQLFNTPQLSMKAGGGLLLNSDFSKSLLHAIYLSGRLWFVDYSIGKEGESWVAYDDRITSGSYLLSQNARPLPKAIFGIKDYLPLRLTKGWLEVRGAISHGWLNDDRGDHRFSASDILLHEKWAYARLGNIAVKPYGGLVHSAFMGGRRPDGTKIPIDYWPSFFAKGSAKLGGGELTNAAGAHMGLWDFGLYYERENFGAQFYYQKPFADGSGMRIWDGRNKDHIIGLLICPKQVRWLKKISLEWLKTDVQSDYGIPDHVYPVDYNGHKAGSIVFEDQVDEDLDGFMHEVFGVTSSGWTWPEVVKYMEKETNEGYRFGGRDDYMNNGTYYNGWTYHGLSMGTPLYHTLSTAQKYYDGGFNKHSRFINNRVNGFHIGMEGQAGTQFQFRLKVSYTKNFGSYAEEFLYRYSWERTEGYFYGHGKKQCYSFLEGIWELPGLKKIQINAALAYDFGQLYHSFGARVGLCYRTGI